jgi:hypothetical protein
MGYKAILFNALMKNEIEGNEEEIVRALTLADEEDWKLFRKTTFFHEVIASVWRNHQVINCLHRYSTLSFYDFVEILKKVKFTPDENKKICDTVLERSDGIDSKKLLKAITGDKDAIVCTVDQMWNVVFAYK